MDFDIQHLESKDFPKLLQEIPDPPKRLYYRGLLPDEDAKLLVVVGSRKFTQYGKDVTEKLISGLAGSNISIVSGLALGIDGIAHKAAIENNLHTVAVLGSGLSPSVIYPSAHKHLADRILDSGGCLLSELPPETKAAQHTFPKRNRIAAGMSHAVLIIEAVEKSGTLITAKLGMEYNRDVLTVPGSINSVNSFGPHYLIKNGAIPITNVDDLLVALEMEPGTQQTLYIEDLNPEQKAVYDLIIEPLEREQLIQKSPLPIQKMNVILSSLELRGIIRERLGKIERI